jgi:hypothetical protein
MRRHFSFLGLALLGLGVMGCGRSTPEPQLGSPDRQERIRAVRQAQDQYGTRTPDSKGQEP